MEEIWKIVNIEGLRDRYEVSNFGRVKTLRFKRVVANSRLSQKGYPVVRMVYPNHKTRTFFTHRVVALSFIPNPNNYPQINHKDCDKTNNHVSNLEWCTNKMNGDHARANGRKSGVAGEDHPKARLTEIQVLKIRDMFARGYTRRQLGQKYKTAPSNIKDIVLRRSWKHI